jgi:hypothetical protein
MLSFILLLLLLLFENSEINLKVKMHSKVIDLKKRIKDKEGDDNLVLDYSSVIEEDVEEPLHSKNELNSKNENNVENISTPPTSSLPIPSLQKVNSKSIIPPSSPPHSPKPIDEDEDKILLSSIVKSDDSPEFSQKNFQVPEISLEKKDSIDVYKPIIVAPPLLNHISSPFPYRSYVWIPPGLFFICFYFSVHNLDSSHERKFLTVNY